MDFNDKLYWFFRRLNRKRRRLVAYIFDHLSGFAEFLKLLGSVSIIFTAYGFYVSEQDRKQKELEDARTTLGTRAPLDQALTTLMKNREPLDFANISYNDRINAQFSGYGSFEGECIDAKHSTLTLNADYFSSWYSDFTKSTLNIHYENTGVGFNRFRLQRSVAQDAYFYFNRPRKILINDSQLTGTTFWFIQNIDPENIRFYGNILSGAKFVFESRSTFEKFQESVGDIILSNNCVRDDASQPAFYFLKSLTELLDNSLLRTSEIQGFKLPICSTEQKRESVVFVGRQNNASSGNRCVTTFGRYIDQLYKTAGDP